MLNTTCVQSIAISSVGMPSMAIRPPWAMLASIWLQRGRAARHLQADVEALGHAELPLHLVEAARARVDGEGRPEPLGQVEAVRVEIGDDDVARAGVAHDRGRHAADRAGAGDEHVLAEHGEGERGVDGVAERVEDRGDVHVDAGPVVPDVRHRQRDELGEGAGPVHADALRVRAQVPPAGQAVAAAAADDVALAADQVAGVEVAHVGADLDDLARRTRGRSPAAPGSSAAPRRPSARCARRCRRCRCAAPGSARR